MKKDILNGTGALDPVPFADKREVIEHSPALYYLEANNYYLLKKEEAYKPTGEAGVTILTYINDNLGVEVVLAFPMKTAQVFLVANGGSQQIVAPMRCLYENVEVLSAFLIDAAALRAGRQMPNPNLSNERK